MIGSLVYLTVSYANIMFSTSICARYQANPKELHLLDVKRIFRYLERTPNLRLWYPHDFKFNLNGYTDFHYVGFSLDREITFGGCQFLENRLISLSGKKHSSLDCLTAEVEYVVTGKYCAQILCIQN